MVVLLLSRGCKEEEEGKAKVLRSGTDGDCCWAGARDVMWTAGGRTDRAAKSSALLSFFCLQDDVVQGGAAALAAAARAGSGNELRR